MARQFLVVIRLDVLRSNLSKADGQDYSEEEIRRWLLDAGFTPEGAGWRVAEADLGQLDPAEVSAATPIDDVNG